MSLPEDVERVVHPFLSQAFPVTGSASQVVRPGMTRLEWMMGCLLSNSNITGRKELEAVLKTAERALSMVDNRMAQLGREAEPVAPVKTGKCFHNIDRDALKCTECGTTFTDAVDETWSNGGAP